MDPIPDGAQPAANHRPDPFQKLYERVVLGLGFHDLFARHAPDILLFVDGLVDGVVKRGRRDGASAGLERRRIGGLGPCRGGEQREEGQDDRGDLEPGIDEGFQFGLQIFTGLERFTVETTQRIDGFDDGVNGQIGQGEYRGEEGGVEHGQRALGELRLDAEQHFAEHGQNKADRNPVEKNKERKPADDDEHQEILPRPKERQVLRALDERGRSGFGASVQRGGVLIKSEGPRKRNQWDNRDRQHKETNRLEDGLGDENAQATARG